MNEKLIQRRATVTWTEDITELVPVTPPSTGFYARTIGRRTVQCSVDIEIDLDAVVRLMGRRAACSKSGKCVDGHVKVKRAGSVTELSRQMTNTDHDQHAEDESNYQKMIGNSLKRS